MAANRKELLEEVRSHLRAAVEALLPASTELHVQWGRFVGGAPPVFSHLDLMSAVDTAELHIGAALAALTTSVGLPDRGFLSPCAHCGELLYATAGGGWSHLGARRRCRLYAEPQAPLTDSSSEAPR